MEIIDAIKERHSVRQYYDKQIDEKIVFEEQNQIEQLKAEIMSCHQESGLNIQLITNESKAFNCFMAHYGKFVDVKNYISLIGKKSKNLDELCGYYGEKLVLKAQQLGLNTCWVAMSYKKIPSAFVINKDEKLVVVISIGYGKNKGKNHKSKTIEEVSNVSTNTPEWFKNGVELALLAPTAMNQQKFKILYNNDIVTLKAGIGMYTKLDLGIIKYHFEIGANRKI